MVRTLILPVLLSFAAAVSWGGGAKEDSQTPVPAPAKTEAEAPKDVKPAASPKKSFAGSYPAPEFPAGLEWLNVPSPLSLSSLRGKVVLLDFWTYGCINCIHNLPYVKALQKEFAAELVVIGVHSAKFANEGKGENIRNIVRRYEIPYAVVNDKDFQVWSLWGAQAWPTLVLVDPAGNIVGGKSGEGFYETFRPVIASLIEEFGAAGKINRRPIDLKAEERPATVLSFPGKVRADERFGRLFIADSGHNRILVTELATGKILDAAGTGAGFKDGSFEEARFRNPQGLAVSADGKVLYVADTDNHAVRRLDLAGRRVVTVAGTGNQAETYPPDPGVGTQVTLSSPWDLALRGNELFVAMAGSHQIWRIDLGTSKAEPIAGSGAEGFLDGPGETAELAQPSGLALSSDGRLYFADSEGSSIRWVDLAKPGYPVATLAGSGKSLFEFGYRDGVGNAALFQHPLGVAVLAGAVYAADTYNHRIRRIDPATGKAENAAGSESGFRNGRGGLFNEPGGLDAAGGRLYVADTNNHTVRVLDPASGEVSSFVLKGLERLTPAALGSGSGPAATTLDPVKVGPGGGEVRLSINLPEGFKPNPEAPSSFTVRAEGKGLLFTGTTEILTPGPKLPVLFPAAFSPGEGKLVVELSLVYCETEKESLCYLERRVLEVPYRVESGAGSVLDVAWRVSLRP